MPSSSIITTLRASCLPLLLAAASTASSEPAPSADPTENVAPAAALQRRAPAPSAQTPPPSMTQQPTHRVDGRQRALILPTAPVPPPVVCYRSAQRGQGDAFDCDLAVQIARDSGSRQALAAALANRALLLTDQGRLEPALADLDAAVAATPDDPAVHGNRGNLLLRLGRPEEALAAHHRAVQLAPQDPRGYYNLAFSYLALGDLPQAEREIATVRALLERRAAVRVVDTPAADADRSR